MKQSGFEKLERSKNVLYGPRKLILCGFSAPAQAKFKTLLDMIGCTDLPLVWTNSENYRLTLSELLELENGYRQGHGSDMVRAIIASGITQIELHRLMNGSRQAGMQKALWAVLTPVSEKWTLSKLLHELKAEQKKMAERSRSK